MTRNKAIEILEQQRQKVLDPDIPINTEWTFETASYIREFFGLDSVEYSRISQFNWELQFLNTTQSEEKLNALNENESNILIFLENCKQTIKNKGLFKPTKNNLLADRNNATLISIIFSISIIVFGIGFYFGTEKTNKDFIKTEKENTILKDSLSTIKTLIDSDRMTNKEK